MNKVRRERAERADIGGNFQQMFDMLRMEIRELRQKDTKWERERERETGIGSRERRATAGTGNPAPQARRRSRIRGVRAIQGWTDTGGVPVNKPWTQGFSPTAAQ